MTSEPRARFGDLVAAEWIKLWSLRSTCWTLVLSALAIIGFSGYTAYEDYQHFYAYPADAPADFSRYAMSDAFPGASCMVLILAIGAVGANVIVGEYGTGLIRTTFVAVPARRSVMAAKVLVVAAVTTVFGALVAAASFGLTQAILSAGDAGLSIGDPGALRAVTASALLAPVAALTGMAIGVVIRHSVTTMVTFVLVFILIPLGLGDNRYLTAVVSHATPYYSWLRLTIEGSFGLVRYPWTTTGAWTVYAVWALVAAALTVITVHRRDQ